MAEYAWVGDDLCKGLDWMCTHPDEMVRRILAGQRYVERGFCARAIAEEWLAAMESAEPPRITVTGGARAPVRLNLGCGDKRLEGYVNIDTARRAGTQPDMICDIRRLKAFPTDHADEILAVHVVEHFDRWEVAGILEEWLRVLAPGGKLILECPDITYACSRYVQSRTGGTPLDDPVTMWPLYGDPSWRDPLMMHRWGYDPSSLGELMRSAGLVNVRQEPAQFKKREPRDMRVVGEKPTKSVSGLGASLQVP
jgi:hypothetical protein